MSAYCTEANLIDRFGRDDVLRVSDYEDVEEPSEDTIARAIAGASALIDSYCAGLYAVPFAPVPDVVRDCATDLAWCRLLSGRDSLTDKWEARCQDWVGWLEKVSEGKVKIPGAAAAAGAPAVTYDAQPRIFGRDYRL